MSLAFPRNCLECAQSIPGAKEVPTPLSKQLQGHEGEHEEAEHEEQEDVGDLRQRVADAAERPPDLPGQGNIQRQRSTPPSPHHPWIKPLKWGARDPDLSSLFIRGILEGKTPATNHSELRRQGTEGPRALLRCSCCREALRDRNPSFQATKHRL